MVDGMVLSFKRKNDMRKSFYFFVLLLSVQVGYYHNVVS